MSVRLVTGHVSCGPVGKFS